MKTNQIVKTLQELKNHFQEDRDVLEAVNFLLKKVRLGTGNSKAQDKKTVRSLKLTLPKELQTNSNALAVFSDGACRGNPGPGSWATIAQNGEGEIIFELSGHEELTTNNQMELQGAILGLTNLILYIEKHKLKKSTPVYLFSDSQYVVNGIEKWMEGWKNRGWKKADKKPPENLPLWQDLDGIKQKFTCLKVKWVKGHSGHPQNELCDQMANELLDQEGF